LKVHDLIGSNPARRALVAVSLAFAMAAGIAVPLMATAQEVQPVAAPLVSAEATVTAVATTVTTTVTSAPVAVPTVTVAKKLTVRQIVAKVGRNAGLSTRQVAALLWIAKRESNFHPTSESRSECHGLFQLSKGMAHGHPWKNPTWNTKRAIKYMRGRYGGVLQAKAFWSSHHWY
jgi:hypothetical protein